MFETITNSCDEDNVTIGAGPAGIHAALALAQKYPGRTVHLIEKASQIGGTFRFTPGRIAPHHYNDVATALQYLEYSIQFRKEFPDCFIDDGKPWQKGLYAIPKTPEDPKSLLKGDELDKLYQDPVKLISIKNHCLDSMTSPEKIREIYAALKAKYAELVKDDPANEVYGPPENFSSELPKDQWPVHINPEVTQTVFQTQEVLLNVEKYVAELQKKIEKTPNIKLHLNTTVINISPGMREDARFVVRSKTNDKEELTEFNAGFIVNAAWENAESVAATLEPGFYQQMEGVWDYTVQKEEKKNQPTSATWRRKGDEKPQYRLKVLMEFPLPDELKMANSVFFFDGPHCMFSNSGELGKGYPEGRLTFAEITNIATTTDINLTPEIKRLRDDQATLKEKTAYARQLFAGGSRYLQGLPSYTNQQLEDLISSNKINLNFKIVKTYGPSEEKIESVQSVIHNPNSSIHERNGLRVLPDTPFIGSMIASALKGGSYAPQLGAAVVKSVENAKRTMTFIKEIAKEANKTYNEETSTILLYWFQYFLISHFKSEDFSSMLEKSTRKQFFATIKQKQDTMQKLLTTTTALSSDDGLGDSCYQSVEKRVEIDFGIASGTPSDVLPTLLGSECALFGTNGSSPSFIASTIGVDYATP